MSIQTLSAGSCVAIQHPAVSGSGKASRYPILQTLHVEFPHTRVSKALAVTAGSHHVFNSQPLLNSTQFSHHHSIACRCTVRDETTSEVQHESAASLNGSASSHSDSDSSAELGPHCPATLELYTLAPESAWHAVEESNDFRTSDAREVESAGAGAFMSSLAQDKLRAEATASLAEGVMPPWEQEGLLRSAEGLDLKTLVNADFVYNKELR